MAFSLGRLFGSAPQAVPSGAEEREAAGSGIRKYRIFISYSHKDKETAEWLHRRLDGYRPPPALSESLSDEGDGRREPWRVFLDREELGAGGELNARIREAIAGSQSLLVICSPHAARSGYVDREIAEFKRLHGST